MEESVDQFRRDLASVLRRAENLPQKTIKAMTFDHSLFCNATKDMLQHLGVKQDKKGNFVFEEK